ncbi:MAG: DUF6272 family protein [Polyangiaceae bacterium]
MQTIQLDVRIPTEWGRIEPAREAIGFLIAAVYADTDLKDALSMVCAELLENAIKYGKPNESGVRLQLQEEPESVVISVSNSIENESHHTAALQEKLDWIRGFADATEAYMAALAQVYERPEEEQNGGLGLVRIAYEGGCTLDCSSDQNTLTVHARHRRGPAAKEGLCC